MHISAYILPRRVILTLLVFLGLFLRLWGISWPQEGIPGYSYYPEWGEAIIASLSGFNPVYREEIWTQGLYGVAVLIKGLLAGLAGWLEVWLGLARISSEARLENLLAGRLAVAFMGTAQIWLAYHVARRWFDSVGTGLTAAAWLAAAPLMVMESHYLDSGVPLGCMSLLCLWCAHSLQQRFRWRHFFLAGLTLGLTLTVKASGIIIAPVFLWAAWLAWRRRRPSWRLVLLWILLGLCGLWVGLTLGSPGFILWLFRMHQNVWASLIPPPLLSGEGWPYVQARAYELFNLLHHWVGWIWLGLWLAGLAALIKKDGLARLALIFFPVLYLAAGLTLLSAPVENLLAAALPLFIILAAWPLVLACRRVPGRLLPGWILAVTGALLLAMPLLNSLRIGYLFWQQPALNAAMEWSKNNLPTPPALEPDELARYFLLPADVPKELQLIKSFDLVGDWAPAWLPRGFALARPYHLYSNSRAVTPREPLAHTRLPINSETPFAVIFADNMAYSRNEGSMFMERPMIMQRLLRFSGEPFIKVRLRNMGGSLAIVQLFQGPWHNRFIELYPGQESSFSLQAKAWPLLMGNTFPLGLRLHQGEKLWADWQWDPLQTAFQDSMLGQPPAALPGSDSTLPGRVMLLLNASRNQQWPLAREIISQLDISAFSLASGQNTPDWWQELADYAGLDPQLLGNASQAFFPFSQVSPDTLSISGTGFSGTLERPRQQSQSWLKLHLRDKLALGHWRLGVLLHEKIDQPILLELWGQDKLAEAVLAAGEGEAHLAFRQTRNAGPLEVRIRVPHQNVFFKGISLQCDLKAYMRQLRDWYLEARARINLQQGNYPQAVRDISSISEPLDQELLFLRLRACAAAGMLEQARPIADSLSASWHDHPEKLARLRDICPALNQPERLSELEGRIADLRPSISKSAAFNNGLALLGYDGPAAAEIGQGSQLGYNLYWQASRRPLVDTEIFFQLQGPGVNIVQTHRLQQGKQAMTSLREGEVARESIQFKLPDKMTPGSYRLLLGLWDKDYKNQYLPIVEGEGKGGHELQLFSLEVK